MLFKCSTSHFVVFLGIAAIRSSASLVPRYEETRDVRVYDVTRTLTAAQAQCTAGQVDKIWEPNLREHIQRPPDYVATNGTRCTGGHLASGYITALNNKTIQKVKVTTYNKLTGLLKVSEYQYTTGGQRCYTKTLWNDVGDDFGRQLKTFANLVTLPPNFPETGWAVYDLPKIEGICKDVIGNTQPGMETNPGMLQCTARAPPDTGRRAVSCHIPPVPPLTRSHNICVQVILSGVSNVYAASCYPVTYIVGNQETLAPLGKTYKPGSSCG